MLNLLVLRFGNQIFEALWNRESIANVEIVFKDSSGDGGWASERLSAGGLLWFRSACGARSSPRTATERPRKNRRAFEIEAPANLGRGSINFGARSANSDRVRPNSGSVRQKRSRARQKLLDVGSHRPLIWSAPAHLSPTTRPNIEPTWSRPARTLGPEADTRQHWPSAGRDRIPTLVERGSISGGGTGRTMV